MRPVAISVDSPDESATLCKKAGYTFTFLSDSGAKVIRSYDVLHPRAGEGGKDIARPAEFLIDASGTVRWANLTDDIRVRATPRQLLSAAHLLQ